MPGQVMPPVVPPAASDTKPARGVPDKDDIAVRQFKRQALLTVSQIRGGVMPSHPKACCPFLERPCADCYVARLTSVTIEGAIQYCGGAYERCAIYKRLVGERRRETSGGGAGAPASTEQ